MQGLTTAKIAKLKSEIQLIRGEQAKYRRRSWRTIVDDANEQNRKLRLAQIEDELSAFLRTKR